MATNFPNSPAVNDTFTSNAKTWKWDGTAWKSVGVQVSGGAAMVFVGEASVTGSPATSFTLSGLNLDLDGTYFIEFKLKSNDGTNPLVALTYNSDTTGTNYYNQAQATDGSSIYGGRSNAATIIQLLTGQDATGWARLMRDVDNYPVLRTEWTQGDMSAMRLFEATHVWNSTANITSLTLTHANASGLAIGSRVRVWKMTSTANGTITTAPVLIRKTANQSRTSTTVLADDSELFTTLAANSSYEFEIGLFCIAQSGPGLQWTPNFTGTVSSTRWRNDQQHNNSASYGVISTIVYSGAYNAMPAASPPGWSNGFGPYATSTIIKGTIAVGASGGKFSLQWAPKVNSGTAATIDEGSYLRVTKIA